MLSGRLLLPQSWEKIVLDLDKHFSKKVDLKRSEKKEILNYLLGNSIGRSKFILSSRFMTGLKDEVPIRITQLPFFISQHKDLTAPLGSCSSCHSKILQGSFDKKEIKN